MTSLSDTLTVGLVLVLLFGAVALYLYTRIQQAEQKITLLESILLDLKMSSEIHSYSELPAPLEPSIDTKGGASTESTPEAYTPFEDEHDVPVSSSSDALPPSSNQDGFATSPLTEVSDLDVEQYKSVVADAVKEDSVDHQTQQDQQTLQDNRTSSIVQYESMTLKELQTLAKTRGIVGANTMKKAPIIEALKTSDRVQASSPLDSGFTVSASGTFLETSAAFPANESA
jgi:hypothetical protein